MAPISLGRFLDSVQNDVSELQCYLISINIGAAIALGILREQWLVVVNGVLWGPFISLLFGRCCCGWICGCPRKEREWEFIMPEVLLHTVGSRYRAVAPVQPVNEDPGPLENI
jgi:hypothetical protein